MRNCCCDNCVSNGDRDCPLENALKDIDFLNNDIDKLQDKIASLETYTEKETQ